MLDGIAEVDSELMDEDDDCDEDLHDDEDNISDCDEKAK